MAVGVFGLQVAYKLKRTELLSLEDTPGGFGGYGTTTRMDFSNDSVTASPRGSLSLARTSLSAISNTPIG